MSVCPSVIPCARKLKLVPIAAVVSQNTNQSCMVCVKSEKNAILVNLRSLESMRQGISELHTNIETTAWD